MLGPADTHSPISTTQSTPSFTEFDQALREFDLMLRYALSEGLAIDDKTRLAVAVQQKLALTPPLPQHSPTPDCFDELLAAHIALSKVIAPATPLSLRATEPASGWLGSLRRPPLVLGMIIVSVIAAVGFVVASILFAQSGTSHPVGEKLIWCFAAALGAVFYVLFTALNYVKDRTFDPRYTPLYVIKFALGVFAGLILAIVLAAPLFNKNGTISSLGPAVIALLGGFSTEAVYQILQRLVDILVAAVRGDNSDAAKAKASESAQKELLTLADDPAMPPDLKSKAIAAAKKVAA
jgi:hypothetical protein